MQYTVRFNLYNKHYLTLSSGHSLNQQTLSQLSSTTKIFSYYNDQFIELLFWCPPPRLTTNPLPHPPIVTHTKPSENKHRTLWGVWKPLSRTKGPPSGHFRMWTKKIRYLFIIRFVSNNQLGKNTVQ